MKLFIFTSTFFVIVFMQKAYPSSYIELCESLDIPKNTRQTITALQKSVNDSSCSGSYSKLAALKDLELTNTYLKDFTPIGFFSNLKSLTIEDGKNDESHCVSKPNEYKSPNLNPIKNLVNLSYLRLKNLGIDNTQFIENLENLRFLNLECNLIENLRNFTKLKKLSTLDISRNLLNDISGISKNKKLINFTIGYNRIKNIEELKNLKHLGFLDAAENLLESIPNLSSLYFINLYGNKITNSGIPKNISTIEHFFIGNNRLNSFNIFKNPEEIVTLDFSQNLIDSFEGIDKFIKLEQLDLSDNPFKSEIDIQLLSRNLSYLNLQGVGVSKFPDISNFSDLRTLNLDDNYIENISYANFPKSLLYLSLKSNKIFEVQLNDISLRKLNLAKNNISKIKLNCVDKSPLTNIILDGNYFQNSIPEIDNCSNLEMLSIKKSNLSSLKFVYNLPNLIDLNISNNPVFSLSDLSILDRLEFIELHNIPLGTIFPKTEENCPTNAKSKVIADWCSK